VTEPAVVLIAIFDTNALLPLLIGATHRARTLRQLWHARCFELCITPQNLAEVERVLTYPKVRRNFQLTDADADEAVEMLKGHAHVLPGLYEGVTAVSDDVSDNVFLAAALEAGADYLVTQDPHLQSLKYYHGTQIVSLVQFAQLFALE
jgi:putative PIN family toxin of toxin-antitoxin system